MRDFQGVLRTLVGFLAMATGLAVTTGFSRADDRTLLDIDPTPPKSPLFFIENQGQFPSEVLFLLRAGSKTVWLTRSGVTFDLVQAARTDRPIDDSLSPREALRQRAEAPRDRLVFTQEFVGARPELEAEGRGQIKTRVNYLLGDDPARWCTGVGAYSEVVFPELYPGIDYRIFATGSDLEQEFLVRPGADASAIRVSFRDIEGLEIEPDGALVVHTLFGPLRERSPVVYQDRLGKRTAVPSAYRLVGERSYNFDVAFWDPELSLVIDPRLEFSTFLGGSGQDQIRAMGLTADERVVVGGYTSSANLPADGGLQDNYGGTSDGFVAQLDPAGTSFEFLTYVGGPGSDYVTDLKVHPSSGALCVTGTTAGGLDSRTTPDAFQRTFQGGNLDAFLLVLDAEATTFTYFSYLGGNQTDGGGSLSLDGSTAIYVSGVTNGGTFPLKQPVQPAPQGDWDGFVARFDLAVPNEVSFSTILGGPGYDEVTSVVTDLTGNAILTGGTSGGFPTQAGAFDRSYNGGRDVFVSKLSREGSLLFSTYLGGEAFDHGYAVTSDEVGNVLVCGTTTHPGAGRRFPSKNALSDLQGDRDAFLAILDPTGSTLVYSTPIGGSRADEAYAIVATGPHNTVVIGGATYSAAAVTFFPVSIEALQTRVNAAGSKGFLALIDPMASRIVYATFLGGTVRSGTGGSPEDWISTLVTAQCGGLVVGGTTGSLDFPRFPTTGVLAQPVHGGGPGDGFVARLSLGSKVKLDPVIVRPGREVEIVVKAVSCEPVIALSLVIDVPLTFLPPADPRDIIRGTAIESQVASVELGNVGTSVTIGLLPPLGPPVPPPFPLVDETVIAKLRFRADGFTAPAVLTTSFAVQVGTNPVRYTEFATAGGTPHVPILEEGTVTINGFFTRGDANFDTRVSISDIVFILYGLFVHAGATFTCLDAVDVNDDNVPNITDVIYLVDYIFRAGPAPPAPETCGVDADDPISLTDCLRPCP